MSSNTLKNLLRYEIGLLEEDEVIDLFQELIDTKLAWTLQGSYGRLAEQLITNGFCTE
jgi:hypothetical protein